jgi:RHS repeat-associated protein
LHACHAGPKLASRENRTAQGEGAFVIRVQARTTSREKALRYDGSASGGTVNTYTWNARNQLTQISQNGNAQLSFAYDAMGRRISKAVQSGAPTQFLYDGDNAVQETQGSTVNPILVGLGIDERFARNDVTGRTYFLADQLNSTIALTDPNGAIQQQYSYDPYGNATPSNPTTGFTNPYQYTGREADSQGLYYYRARYYSPLMGGFISEDPIEFDGGQPSFYAYVGGDPVDYVDSSGLARHDPNSLYCRNLAGKIQNIGDQLDKRWQELDQGGLPQYIGPGESFYQTMRGHRTIINMMDRNRRDLQDKYDDDCGPPPPPLVCPGTASNAKKAAGTAAALTALYWVISEGSRLFPPRNLVPVP